MHRLVRALAPLAVAAGLAVPGGAYATSTLTFAFAVPCDNPSGTGSAGLSLPNGVYAVTVSGGCVIDYNTHSQSVGTPCTVAGQPVPCVPSIGPIENVPGFNSVSTGGVGASVGGPGAALNGCFLGIAIDGACFAGQAGTFFRPGSGPMTVAFVDSNYGDNKGELLVTVTWTPL